MQTVFVLADGRSGTTFLRDLFRKNVPGCVAKHEPYFSRSRPSMFGKPVYDYCHGNTDLERYGKHSDCFTLHSPSELNDPKRVAAMFEFFGLKISGASIVLSGRSNQTPGFPTVVGNAEDQEFRAVVAALPAKYLDIFRREPYSQWEWSKLLLP